MNTELKTNITKLKGIAPLHLHYATQTHAQTAYMELNQNGSIHFDFNAEIGNSVPCSVMNGQDRRFSIANNITIDGIKSFYNDYKKLIQRIINGMADEWDGSNYKGTLTEDADTAFEELDSIIINLDWDQYELASIVVAADYLENNSIEDYKDDPTEEGIEKLLLADSEEPLIVFGIQDWIDEQTSTR